jgi:DNA invertase Pin-like site-specific DNA recombinase
MQKAIGYVRVSTAGQVVDGVSLDAQKAKITAWALANDYDLVAIHEDAGITGTSMDKRPGLQAAIAAVSKGMALVAYSISRIARSTSDMLEIATGLEKKGADLVSLSEKIDTSSAAGKMVFRMMAVLSEFERDQISERTTAALAHKKAKRETYSALPLGYADQDGKLVPVDEELRVVAEIRDMRDGGMSLERIAADLNSRGIVGKRGGKFHGMTIKKILENTLHH